MTRLGFFFQGLASLFCSFTIANNKISPGLLWAVGRGPLALQWNKYLHVLCILFFASSTIEVQLLIFSFFFLLPPHSLLNSGRRGQVSFGGASRVKCNWLLFKCIFMFRALNFPCHKYLLFEWELRVLPSFPIFASPYDFPSDFALPSVPDG